LIRRGGMKSSFFNSAGWQILAQTDIMTKLILFGLFAVSVVCIAIIVFKFVSFRKQKQQMHELLKQLRALRQFTDLVSVSKEFKESIGGKLLIESLGELRLMLDHAKKDGGATLKDQDFADLELFTDKLSGSLLLEEEVYLPVLGSCAAVGPLVGLFGTIWGLIHAFLDISQQQSTDIATVAPGIAEALITTLGGLVVAIPAMVAFHYFSNELRKLEFQLGDVSDKFLALAKQAFVK